MQHPRLSRRALLAGMGAAGLGSVVGARAESPINLRVDTRVLDVKGKAASVFGIFGPKGPGLELVYGDGFDVSLTNGLTQETLIHWHGLVPPVTMDGTPMLSSKPLAAGERRRFSFPNLESGTHWMHSHVGLQEQRLLAAPLIIKEKGDALIDEQEHVVMLHDFTFRDPAEILSELRGGGGAHSMSHATSGEMDHSKMGHASHGSSGAATAMAHADIAYDAMLANDRTLDDPEVVKAEKAGRFRLRIINACAATNMWIDLGQIEGQLIAVDGKAIVPVSGKRFPLAIAQRADIRLQLPRGSGAWPVLFQAEASPLRSGVILQSGSSNIAKISDRDSVGEPLTLDLEMQLRTIIAVRPDPSTRVEMVMLTGGGSDYSWGLNGNFSMHDVLFSVSEGERVDMMFHNMTSMAHPMHLHGHYFQVVEINGVPLAGAVRDTVLVPVGGTVTVRFDAENPGTWALHCHHLYHMNAGMMGAIAYKSAA